MKIRMQRNSVRLRLTQTELQHFGTSGRVEETVSFGLHPATRLTYALERNADIGTCCASFGNGTIRLQIPGPLADEWVNTGRVGIECRQWLDEQTTLHLLVEKDFRCLDGGRAEENADAFPNPLANHPKNC
ncbi:MAG: hypothetical protein H7Z75_02365 [Ferruginibacter sp.]|nr:hypothetical protein [Cytophagales bacterium]